MRTLRPRKGKLDREWVNKAPKASVHVNIEFQATPFSSAQARCTQPYWGGEMSSNKYIHNLGVIYPNCFIPLVMNVPPSSFYTYILINCKVGDHKCGQSGLTTIRILASQAALNDDR